MKYIKRLICLSIEHNHINLHDFKNILLISDFYMEWIDIILKEYYLKCPICYSKYYARKIINQPKFKKWLESQKMEKGNNGYVVNAKNVIYFFILLIKWKK